MTAYSRGSFQGPKDARLFFYGPRKTTILFPNDAFTTHTPMDPKAAHPPLHSSMHSTHPSFGIYTENQFPHPHKLQAWCPTADLLALVSLENDLEMYRLSWEKHWSIRVKEPPKQAGGVSRISSGDQADVVSLAWRPDGRFMSSMECPKKPDV